MARNLNIPNMFSFSTFMQEYIFLLLASYRWVKIYKSYKKGDNKSIFD